MVKETKSFKTEKEKMLAGELYSPVEKELSAERMKASELLHKLNVKEYSFTSKARSILKKLLPNVPEDIVILAPFYCDYGYNIYCGKRVFFNLNCIVLDVAKVTIGSHVLIGPGVHIYTATHPLDSKTRRSKMYGREVTIGDDCWIGGGAIILPGVTIGKGSIIGAGAIVNVDIPEYSLAVGNPAKVIRKLK